MRKMMNISPINRIFPIIIDISKDIQVVKQIMHENSFRKNLTKNDFEKLDKFGKRKAEIVYNAIKKATTNVDLAKLMHASNLFVGLGSKKLELLVHFTEKPSYNDIISIDGFSDISANSYLNS